MMQLGFRIPNSFIILSRVQMGCRCGGLSPSKRPPPDKSVFLHSSKRIRLTQVGVRKRKRPKASVLPSVFKRTRNVS